MLNLQDPKTNKTLNHLGGETDMEATNVDDNQCYNGDILLRTRGIPDGVVKIEGLGERWLQGRYICYTF